MTKKKQNKLMDKIGKQIRIHEADKKEKDRDRQTDKLIDDFQNKL